ncbi:peptidoglycan DD-metalloendopeptidase family protein [Xanthobacter dioxanivorans]|uniref:Peptidoglycan DD-metalloendopeptidase family protein n=1 Tax=Xanthobacter dioxanivorans TaxID=2528964 RepID=A0A974PKA9_9HYPH|nr:M23 family metallopeptidase [Xanthobacter dioxanivorans]QRG05143.1 peptidoglycan DD-metalloendopeptidase family protein [Xanthobacter dioxanivorans]
MRIPSETHGRIVFARLALIGLVSGTVAGCSSDTSRFAADSPQPGYGYQGQPHGQAPAAPEVTGSLGAAPTGRVDSVPLPPPGQAAAGAPPASYAAAGSSQPLYGAPGYGAGNYGAPAASAPPPVTASARPAAAGTHVVVAGETLGSIARMYNVSPASLGSVNGIEAGRTVRTGQTLIIPPGGNGAAQPRGSATAAAPAAGAKPPQVAAASGTLGTLPASATSTPAKPATGPVPAAAAAKPQTTAPVVAQAAPPVAATPAKGASASAKAPETKVETAAKVSPVADADDSPRTPGSGPQFRAPVRGRVIASFGPKPGGARNDGVNFAVPEGTAVRAAEDGVVAYSGNELKDYGNLVLIKHSDGYVTAYAHNSELSVKRGDTVRRGQVIAKAGQSGGVTAPQLHFEIRKGSQPVDPGRYVAGL